jgi:hypothetical protein
MQYFLKQVIKIRWIAGSNETKTQKVTVQLVQDVFRHPSQGMDLGGPQMSKPPLFFLLLLMINDIFDPDKVGTVTSHSEIKFISPHEISVFISLGNISISHTFM